MVEMDMQIEQRNLVNDINRAGSFCAMSSKPEVAEAGKMLKKGLFGEIGQRKGKEDLKAWLVRQKGA
jgi:hypothetical protein